MCIRDRYGLAAFSTLFLLGVLWVVESLEPERLKTFDLKVTAADPTAIRRDLEQLLRRSGVKYELRTAGPKELVYEANLPVRVPTCLLYTSDAADERSSV